MLPKTLGQTNIIGMELVENPNPKGRKDQVTPQYREQWLREHGPKKAKDTAPADETIEDMRPDEMKGPKTDSEAISDNPKKERKIVSILEKLSKMSNQGKKAPNFDLCNVSIPGTNLFCAGNKGIERQDMPQLKGSPTPGSPADKLPKDENGEVNTEDLFEKALKDSGKKLTSKEVPAESLRATQNQLVGSKVAGMTEALKKDPTHPKITAPIYVSKDGYILDGHHRWAAQVGLRMASGKPVDMDVIEVDMGAEELVKFTNDFANRVGIAQKKAKASACSQGRCDITGQTMSKERVDNICRHLAKKLAVKWTGLADWANKSNTEDRVLMDIYKNIDHYDRSQMNTLLKAIKRGNKVVRASMEVATFWVQQGDAKIPCTTKESAVKRANRVARDTNEVARVYTQSNGNTIHVGDSFPQHGYYESNELLTKPPIVGESKGDMMKQNEVLNEKEALTVISCLQSAGVQARVTKVGAEAYVVKAEILTDKQIKDNSNAEEDLGHETILPEEESQSTEPQLKEQQKAVATNTEEVEKEGEEVTFEDATPEEDELFDKAEATDKLSELTKEGIYATLKQFGEKYAIVIAEDQDIEEEYEEEEDDA